MRSKTTRFGSLLGVALVLGWGSGACSGDSDISNGGPTGTGAAGGSGGGDGGTTSTTTTLPSFDDDGDGFTEDDGDCDDTTNKVYPGAEEICDDGLDNNCNGATDSQEPDQDGDGFGPCAGDCDDGDAKVSPVAQEIDGDGIDNNCDGIVDADFDSDGYTVADGDCDDNDKAVHPGAKENCFDGVDNDCNGFIDDQEPDVDMDGYGPCSGDCNEGDPNVHPGATEIDGDGIDNDCDNLVDADIDGDGWTVQNGDCNDLDPAVNPAVFETCGDNVDNDCDGLVDQKCVSKCDLANLYASSVGCEYYAIDANNDPVENYDTQPYAVVVSNTDPTDTAKVEAQTKQGGVWTTIQTKMVAPSTLSQFDLPDRHINYTGIKKDGAYRIISDVPIIAYQFQPINGQTSYTSDASLLLPKSALDKFYYVVGWGIGYGKPQIDIVATEDNTTVKITPSVNTAAGGGVPAYTAKQQAVLPVLNAGDFIQIEGPNSNNAGFSGTYIEADKPIAVFSTHWCANIPSMGCCCDHLEEQIYGLQTWGKTYVASRLPVRNSGTPEPNQWHILASENNTTVTFQATPGVTGLPAGPQTLNAGQLLYLQVGGTVQNPGDFIVKADKPIFLMEYMSSKAFNNASVANGGDPAMNQGVPVEQFLDKYVVLVPPNWVNDFLVITKKVGSTVNLDGAAIAQGSFVTINDGMNPPEWEVARLKTPDGVHKLDGDKPFGVIVLGYDSYDSYAYPGGLDQKVINPKN